MHYLLIYEVVEDYVNRRQPFRSQHLNLAQSFVNRGDLLLGGALSDPADGAVLLFRDELSAREFAAMDPYVANGLITTWRVRSWATVAGVWLEKST